MSGSPGWSSTKTLFSAMGHWDLSMVLVLTEDGPEFWHCKDNRLKAARSFGKHFFTIGFANEFARRLFETGGKIATAMRLMRSTWLQRGCTVTCLADRNIQAMSSMVLDILESKAMKNYLQLLRVSLAQKGEMCSIAADATYKLSLKVNGQTRVQRHNYVTCVGFRGCPLAISPAYGEAPETVMKVIEKTVPRQCRSLVENMSFDATNPKLYKAAKSQQKQLLGISLDSTHLAIGVDQHSSKRRSKPSLIGLVVRSIMGKFLPSQTSPAKTSRSTTGVRSWSPPIQRRRSCRMSSQVTCQRDLLKRH
jgi:hypothetical protein